MAKSRTDTPPPGEEEDDMASPAKDHSGPGRPSLSIVAARPPSGTLEAVKMMHPMRIGINCPGCARVVDPRVLRTNGSNERTVECTSCKRRYIVTYDLDGWPKEYRFIRG